MPLKPLGERQRTGRHPWLPQMRRQWMRQMRRWEGRRRRKLHRDREAARQEAYEEIVTLVKEAGGSNEDVGAAIHKHLEIQKNKVMAAKDASAIRRREQARHHASVASAAAPAQGEVAEPEPAARRRGCQADPLRGRIRQKVEGGQAREGEGVRAQGRSGMAAQGKAPGQTSAHPPK